MRDLVRRACRLRRNPASERSAFRHRVRVGVAVAAFILLLSQLW